MKGEKKSEATSSALFHEISLLVPSQCSQRSYRSDQHRNSHEDDLAFAALPEMIRT
jgi:hypothetical protein